MPAYLWGALHNFQIDIRGDPFGLLTAHPMAPLVSLHHLDHVNPMFENQTQYQSLKTLMKAYQVDPARIMQQSLCYYKWNKWSVSISWGYVVQIYPSLLTPVELEMPLQTFKTWRSFSNGPFTFNTRPVSPDPCEQPVRFYLDWIEEDGKGGTTTTYNKKFSDKPSEQCKKSYYAPAMAIKKIVVSALKTDNQQQKKVCFSLPSPCLFAGVSVGTFLCVLNESKIIAETHCLP